MKSQHWLLLLGLAAAAVASGSDDLQAWKTKQARYQRESAILTAQGKRDAAKFRLAAAELEYPRLLDMAKRKIITEMRAREGKRDRDLAEVAFHSAEIEVEVALNEKALDAFTTECQAGKATACDEASHAYTLLFRAKRDIAVQNLQKTRAELELETFQYNCIRQLVEAQALVPEVLAEAEKRLAAKQAEENQTEAQLKLAEAQIR